MSRRVKSKRRSVARIIAAAAFVSFVSLFVTVSRAGDTEYFGTLESELVPNTQDLDQITFRPVRDLSKIKTAKPIEQGANVTAGRLYHPPADKSSILTVLVEPEDGAPYIYGLKRNGLTLAAGPDGKHSQHRDSLSHTPFPHDLLAGTRRQDRVAGSN